MILDNQFFFPKRRIKTIFSTMSTFVLGLQLGLYTFLRAYLCSVSLQNNESFLCIICMNLMNLFKRYDVLVIYLFLICVCGFMTLKKVIDFSTNTEFDHLMH